MTRTRAVTTAKSPVTWILVMNGNQAQIYSRRRIMKPGAMHADSLCNQFEELITHEPVPVQGMRWHAEPADPQEAQYHKINLIFRNLKASSADADEQEEVMAQFAKTIASQINKAGNKHSFHRLVLIGSDPMLVHIKQHLNAKTLNRVVAEMPNDLVRYRSYNADRASK